MINQTAIQYAGIISTCKDIFIHKNKDYGASWRVMRIPSIIDQIFIKAQRIRTIEEKVEKKINEGVESEFMGIINYCVIALIQLDKDADKETPIADNDLSALYDRFTDETYRLMEMKNHDYGEAWREMRVSTFTDMLLMRLLRIRQIQDAGGTVVSEGIESNIMDMINYAVFALIRLSESR